MKQINYDREIWEGWTVQKFIDTLKWEIELIMMGNSFTPKFQKREHLKIWCINNQPYYKKYIPEVVDHFAQLYNLK